MGQAGSQLPPGCPLGGRWGRVPRGQGTQCHLAGGRTALGLKQLHGLQKPRQALMEVFGFLSIPLVSPPPTLAACSAAGHPNGAIVGPGTPAPAYVSLLSDCVCAFLFTNVFLIYLQIFILSSIPERTSRNLKILRKKKKKRSTFRLSPDR